MPALARKFKKIFAGSASNNGVFGSAAALSPDVSNDPTVIESLAAWSDGWDAATIAGTKLPAVQDMQGLKYDTDYHLAYIYQTGMQVYDSQTTYYETDLVRKVGTTEIWKSLVDDNTGNSLVEGANWTFVTNLNIVKFKNYSSLLAVNTIYQAATDGILMATVNKSTPGGSSFSIKVDNFSPPTTIRSISTIDLASGNDTNSSTVSIKAGDFYSVDIADSTFSIIYFQPLSNT